MGRKLILVGGLLCLLALACHSHDHFLATRRNSGSSHIEPCNRSQAVCSHVASSTCICKLSAPSTAFHISLAWTPASFTCEPCANSAHITFLLFLVIHLMPTPHIAHGAADADSVTLGASTGTDSSDAYRYRFK